MATDRTVASCILNGSSKLPIRRMNSKLALKPSSTSKFYVNCNNNSNNNESPVKSPTTEPNKWKEKFQDAEEKRKVLLGEREKARRTINDLEKRYSLLKEKHDEVETELFERNENLAKLTTASKGLFKEYDALKNQYDVETCAMHKALADASQWYKENKVLRRKTMLIDADSVDEGVDSCESGPDSDLENLRESVKNLSLQVAHLQAELNASKLSEFEAIETNAQLSHTLEVERTRNEKLKKDMEELTSSHEQIIRVSNIMKRELEDLKEMVQRQKNSADILRQEANDYKMERNVLAHQSTILMEGINDDGMEKILLVQEIEELKCTLEDERGRHLQQLDALQEKLDDKEGKMDMEVLEERLKLAEFELKHAQERAEKAENDLAKSVHKAPPAPVAPPPPPPPPPVVPLRVKKLNRNSPPPVTEPIIDTQMSLQTKKTPPTNAGANDEIINQIKGGLFTLRKSKNENGAKKEREAPKAVTEMLNILGSLRRTSKNKAVLTTANYGDVHL